MSPIECPIPKGPPVSFLSRLLRPRQAPQAEIWPLWHRVVGIAREKAWYARFGVADTIAGRFDAITLVLSLVLLRMEREAALHAPSVHLTELFVTDMDGQLRESGVGDLVVGKHIGRLMSVLGGRLGAYREALAQEDDTALIAALTRNVTLAEGSDLGGLASATRALAAQFASLDSTAILAGSIAR